MARILMAILDETNLTMAMAILNETRLYNLMAKIPYGPNLMTQT